MYQYYLSSDVHPEKQVTEQEFIRAEQNAGFRSKFGPHHVATGGFSGRGMHGRVVFVQPEPVKTTPGCGCHMDDWGEFHPCTTCEAKHQAQETALLALKTEPKVNTEHIRSDHTFYTRQLLARAAKVMEVEPEFISWFDVVDWMEKHHGIS